MTRPDQRGATSASGSRPELPVVRRHAPLGGHGQRTLVVLALVVALGGLGLFVTGLLAGWALEVYGSALAIGLLALAYAVRRAFALTYPSLEVAEPRRRPGPPLPAGSIPAAQAIGRRSLLLRAVGVVGGLFALGMAAPLGSLARPRRDPAAATVWAAGVRLVDDLSRPVRADALPAQGLASAWPEGRPRQELSAVIVVRLPEGPGEGTNPDWVVNGSVVAYSKLCTHMGCPIGLYRAQDAALFCPCHQAQFDAVHGARPVFGPAVRPLPQLPLGVDDDGYLVALGDFTERVGPPAG